MVGARPEPGGRQAPAVRRDRPEGQQPYGHRLHRSGMGRALVQQPSETRLAGLQIDRRGTQSVRRSRALTLGRLARLCRMAEYSGPDCQFATRLARWYAFQNNRFSSFPTLFQSMGLKMLGFFEETAAQQAGAWGEEEIKIRPTELPQQTSAGSMPVALFGWNSHRHV